MGLGPDNKLYVNVGAPCNICELRATNGQIRRINLDGSGPRWSRAVCATRSALTGTR